MKNPRSIAHHFPEIDLGEFNISELAEHWACISVFDHWLSEKEFSECQIITYSVAMEDGALGAYLEGERKFMALYELISHHGWLCNYPRPRRKFNELNEALQNIFIASLREERLMDGYSLEFGVRVKGRYDRTDLIIADSVEKLQRLKEEALKCGLFVLPE